LAGVNSVAASCRGVLSKRQPLNRSFEVVLKDLLREIRRKLDTETQEEFDADAERVRLLVEEYEL
jgi:hypothetical protein